MPFWEGTAQEFLAKLHERLEAPTTRCEMGRDPEQHDRLVAQISHLPQILSTLLAEQTSGLKDFAGPGWKSVTRLAASPFHVWRDILQTSGSLPDELSSFITRLRELLDALEAGNTKEIEALFERANRAVSGEGQ